MGNSYFQVSLSEKSKSLHSYDFGPNKLSVCCRGRRRVSPKTHTPWVILRGFQETATNKLKKRQTTPDIQQTSKNHNVLNFLEHPTLGPTSIPFTSGDCTLYYPIYYIQYHPIPANNAISQRIMLSIAH